MLSAAFRMVPILRPLTSDEGRTVGDQGPRRVAPAYPSQSAMRRLAARMSSVEPAKLKRM